MECEEGSNRGRDCFEPANHRSAKVHPGCEGLGSGLNSCNLGLIALSSDSSASRRSFPGRKRLQIVPAEVIGDEIV